MASQAVSNFVARGCQTCNVLHDKLAGASEATSCLSVQLDHAGDDDMQHLDCRLVNPSAGKSHPLLVHHVHSADGRGLLAAVTASDHASDLSRLPAKQRRALRQHLLGVRRRELNAKVEWRHCLFSPLSCTA